MSNKARQIAADLLAIYQQVGGLDLRVGGQSVTISKGGRSATFQNNKQVVRRISTAIQR